MALALASEKIALQEKKHKKWSQIKRKKENAKQRRTDFIFLLEGFKEMGTRKMYMQAIFALLSSS